MTFRRIRGMASLGIWLALLTLGGVQASDSPSPNAPPTPTDWRRDAHSEIRLFPPSIPPRAVCPTLTPPVSPVSADETAGGIEARRQAIRQRIGARDFEGAASLLHSLLQSASLPPPIQTDLRVTMGLVRLMQGCDEEALVDLLPNLDALPELSADLRLLAGEALLRLGRPSEAIVHFYAVAFGDLNLKDPERFIWREHPRYDDACELYLTALLAMDLPQSMIDQSLWMEKSQAGLSDAYPGMVPTRHRKTGDFHYLRAMAYRRLGDEAEVTRSVLEAPLEGGAGRYGGELESLFVEFHRSGRFEIDYGEDLFDFIHRLRVRLSEDDALAFIERTLTEHPKGSEGYREEIQVRLQEQKAALLLVSGRGEEALTLYRTLLASDPAPPKGKIGRLIPVANTLAQLNRLDEAAAAYRQVALLDPKGSQAVEARYFDAYLTAHIPNRAWTASQAFKDLLTEKSITPFWRERAMWMQAWSAYLARKDEEAVKDFEAYEKKYPGSFQAQGARYWIARTEERRGEAKKATAIYSALAGAEPLTYYRLLAAQKLNPAGRAKETIDLGSFRAASRKAAERLKDAFPAASARAEWAERIEPLAPHFPWMSAAATYDRLGFRAEASFLWKRILEHLKKDYTEAVQKGKAAPKEPETPPSPAARLKKERGRAVGQAKDPLLADLFALFAEEENWATLHYIFFRMFSERQRGMVPTEFHPWLSQPPAYAPLVQEGADLFGLSDDLMLSIMKTESLFIPWAQSNMKAMGLMQVMPQTGYRLARDLGWTDFSLADLYHPTVSIRLGAYYLSRLLRMFNSQIPLAAAAYNAGPRAVRMWLGRCPDRMTDEWIESISYSQTREYVKKIVLGMAYYRSVWGQGTNAIPLHRPINAGLGEPIDY